MKAKEKAIRDAAAALLDAISKGREDGLTVVWPSKAEGLATIAISETAKAEGDGKPKGPAKGRVS